MEWLVPILNFFAAIAGAGGIWTYLSHRDSTRKATDALLRGMAYDKIMTVGMGFVERGWITKDEYEEFRRYLYEPYKAMGGNGVTTRIMSEVENLPLRPRGAFAEIVNAAKARSDYDQPYPDELPATAE